MECLSPAAPGECAARISVAVRQAPVNAGPGLCTVQGASDVLEHFLGAGRELRCALRAYRAAGPQLPVYWRIDTTMK